MFLRYNRTSWKLFLISNLNFFFLFRAKCLSGTFNLVWKWFFEFTLAHNNAFFHYSVSLSSTVLGHCTLYMNHNCSKLLKHFSWFYQSIQCLNCFRVFRFLTDDRGCRRYNFRRRNAQTNFIVCFAFGFF